MARKGSYPALAAGSLRDLVELQSRVDVKDSAGDFSPVWTSIGREWANLRLLTGFRASETEGVRAQQIITSSIYQVQIHFRADVTTKHRLIVIGPPRLVLNILAVGDPDGLRRKLELMCEQGLTDG